MKTATLLRALALTIPALALCHCTDAPRPDPASDLARALPGGLPPEVERLVLDVSDSQAEEMDTQLSLTLTSEQWGRLRDQGLRWPMRIDAIYSLDADAPTFYVMMPHAVRLEANKVAVVTGSFDNFETDMVLGQAISGGDMPRSTALAVWPTILHRPVAEEYADKVLVVAVDRRGNFYADGVPVLFDGLLEFFRKPLTDYQPFGLVRLALPPGLTAESPEVRDRLAQWRTAAADGGWLPGKPVE